MKNLTLWGRFVVAAIIVAIMVLPLTACGQINNAPIVTNVVADTYTVAPGGTSHITCSASDQDGDTLTYTWEYDGGTISGVGHAVTWTAPSLAGTYSIRATVSDSKGHSDFSNVTINVANPTPTPTLTATATPTSVPTPTPIIAETPTPTPTTESTPTSTIVETPTPTPTSETVSTPTPTPTPVPSDGSIDIKSNPAGAKVYIDGVDTGSITPYVATHISAGNHTIELVLDHYKWKTGNVSVTGGETAYVNWPLTYADDQILTIQPDSSNGKDTYVDERAPDEPARSYASLCVGKFDSKVLRVYIQFDVNSVPYTAVIESATLGLYYSSSYSTRQESISLYRVTSGWNESTINWNNQPMFSTTAVDTVLVPTSPTKTFLFWDVTSMVQSWTGMRGRWLNYGMVLMATDENTCTNGLCFGGSELASDNWRPKLTITYWDPEPSHP